MKSHPTIVAMLVLCFFSPLMGQTKKQLQWMREHPNSPITKQWVKNHPNHPAVQRWKAWRALLSPSTDDPEPRPAAEAKAPVSLLAQEAVGPVRKWSDASGEYQVEAALVELTDTAVILKRIDNGLVVKLSTSRLSEADQKYLQTWVALSAETKINLLQEEIERMSKRGIVTLQRKLKDVQQKIDTFKDSNAVERTIVQHKLYVLEHLRKYRESTPREDVRKEYSEAIERWENGQQNGDDIKRARSIVYARLTHERRECELEIQQLEAQFKWAGRKAEHLIKGDDSPYVKAEGGYFTASELERRAADAADLAAVRKERNTPRAAADWYVNRLLTSRTIQAAEFVSEGAVKLDPRWRVPGNFLDPTSFRAVTYQVDYVSDAGVKLQRQGVVVVEFVSKGYWDVREGFDFIKFPVWTPSAVDLQKAFGTP